MNEQQCKSYNNSLKKTALAIILPLLIVGCSSTLLSPDSAVDAKKVSLKDSYLNDETEPKSVNEDKSAAPDAKAAEFTRINRLSDQQNELQLNIDLSKQFATTDAFQLSVNELPLADFLHYVFGDLLNVSYILEPKVKDDVTPITLSLKEKVSSRRLFQLAQQVLEQHNLGVVLNDDIFFIHSLTAQNDKSNMAFGFGANQKDVPNVSSEIIQLVPVKYGTSTGLRSTIASLVNASVAIDPTQGLVTLKGKREQILRALSLIELLDSASIHNKAMALLGFEYIDSDTFIEKVTQLLAKEGVSVGGNRGESASVDFIPLEHLGKVVVFATADEIIDRIEYWTKQLDKPATGSEQSFYLYHPKYARASDLGQSLAPLLKSDYTPVNRNNNNTTSSQNTTNTTNKNGVANNTNSVQTIEGDHLRLVVDERSNALIFYSTGKHYQELQPIIRKLDIMPKQVMLEVVIAEVKLTGTFAKGVEYAITSGNNGSNSENFNFNSKSGFSYSIVGIDSNISINLKQTDGLINVLSRPTILVRDGVAASISVGDDIPTVGSTTSDPINGERQTTTIQYRKTGIDLMVTPTVNAQGTVIMTIEQNISNVSPDGVDISGSPSIFERKLSTEVVAGDGQTVMLGGLISENKSTNATSIPFFGSLPLIGHLFRSDGSSRDKTELVILVTPKIVSDINDWTRIKDSFKKGLENISF